MGLLQPAERERARILPSASRICDSFEFGEVHNIMWVPVSDKLANTLTQCNQITDLLLYQTMVSGLLYAALFEDYHVIYRI